LPKNSTDEASVWNWENNRNEPVIRSIPKIIELLGYVPFDTETMTLGEKIVVYRKCRGFNQDEFARELGVDPGTWARWEKDKNKPKGKHLTKVESILTLFN
jgi:DNA-binding XRE family transcriptional regulator